jgi:hypothetical protein
MGEGDEVLSGDEQLCREGQYGGAGIAAAVRLPGDGGVVVIGEGHL